MVTVQGFLNEAAAFLEVLEDVHITSWGYIHAYQGSEARIELIDGFDETDGTPTFFIMKFYDEQGHWVKDVTQDFYPENDHEVYTDICQMTSDFFKDIKRYKVVEGVDLSDLPF